MVKRQVDTYEHKGPWGWVPWKQLQGLRGLFKLDLTKYHREEPEDRLHCVLQREEDEANLVGSYTRKAFVDGTPDEEEVRFHQPVIDLDVSCYLVPSTTVGHQHLYIQKEVEEEAYFDLLDALAACGIISEGYAHFCRERGQSFARVPWVKKKPEDILSYNEAVDEDSGSYQDL